MAERGGAFWTAWAVVLGLAVHAAVGHAPFPQPSDLVLAPLAEMAADPSLYPRDDLLRALRGEAWGYVAVYRLAEATVGVALGFRIVTALIAVATVLAMARILRAVEAGPWVLPLAIGLGLLTGGGGLVEPAFHHRMLALCLVLWALAFVLSGRVMFAGAALGLSAYALPVAALQGGIAGGLALVAAGGAPAIRGLGVMLWVAMLTALPVVLRLAAAALEAEPALDTAVVVTDWNASALLLAAMGTSAGIALWRGGLSAAPAGAVAGLTLPMLLGGAFPEPLLAQPVLAALSATLVAALLGRDWLRDGVAQVAAIAALGVALWLAAVEGTPLGWAAMAAGLVLATLDGARRMAGAVGGAALGGALFLIASQPEVPAPAPGETALFAHVRTDTAADALFVVPPGLGTFRLETRRSVWADDGLLAETPARLAGPVRARLDSLASAAGCAALREAAGADFVVTRAETPCPGLTERYRNDAFVLYGDEP